MATNDSPTGILQAAELFAGIAMLASTMDRLIHFSPQGDEQVEQRDLLLEQCRTLALRIGWMADLGGAKLNGAGGGHVRGGAEEWLLSPSYQSIERRANQ